MAGVGVDRGEGVENGGEHTEHESSVHDNDNDHIEAAEDDSAGRKSTKDWNVDREKKSSDAPAV